MENNKLKYFSKEYWKQYWKKIVINLTIFFLVFLFLLAIDLITKEFIFKWENKEKKIVNTDYEIGNSFIIFKSVLHKGTTIGLFETNLTILHIISFFIIFASLWATTFIKEKKSIIIVCFLAMVSAGSLGNMIDRFLFLGVRDIINLPWANKGVFNFADIWLVLGGVGTVVSITIINLVNYFKTKKQNNNQ
ncbi:signal peptidase II [Metamycoplasma canadense]|nr:signal peptidase II [Metamycoplasma canadense]